MALTSSRDHSAARGHPPSRTLPYGRERYEACWPLVMCLEEVGAVLRARPCILAGAAGFPPGQISGRVGRAWDTGAAGSLNDDGGGIMSVIFVALGILVAFVLGVVLPWALLRKLEHSDAVKED